MGKHSTSGQTSRGDRASSECGRYSQVVSCRYTFSPHTDFSAKEYNRDDGEYANYVLKLHKCTCMRRTHRNRIIQKLQQLQDTRASCDIHKGLYGRSVCACASTQLRARACMALPSAYHTYASGHLIDL